MLAQSLQIQTRDKSGSGCSPDSVVCSLGHSLQSLNPTGLDTQTFECLAPTFGGHASVNKPRSNIHGQHIAQCNGVSNGTGVSTADGVSIENKVHDGNGLKSTVLGHNSNSSIANGSNGTSFLACNAASKCAPVLGAAPSTGPEQLLRCMNQFDCVLGCLDILPCVGVAVGVSVVIKCSEHAGVSAATCTHTRAHARSTSEGLTCMCAQF